jgi:hypothetical protein
MNLIQQIGANVVLVKMPVPEDAGLLNKSSCLGAPFAVIKIIIIMLRICTYFNKCLKSDLDVQQT